jgi:hypothetical protein
MTPEEEAAALAELDESVAKLNDIQKDLDELNRLETLLAIVKELRNSGKGSDEV